MTLRYLSPYCWLLQMTFFPGMIEEDFSLGGMISRDKLLTFLRTNMVATIATVSPDAFPEAASVFFYVSDDFSFFFATKSETQKYINIRHNQHVALVFTRENTLETVQIRGNVCPFADYAEETQALQNIVHGIKERYSFGPSPLDQMNDGDLVVVKIHPEWIRYADFDGSTSGSDSFHHILLNPPKS